MARRQRVKMTSLRALHCAATLLLFGVQPTSPAVVGDRLL